MKIKIKEYDKGFVFTITPETKQDAALVVRFGMNNSNVVNYCNVDAREDGTFGACISIGKSTRSHSSIPRRE